MVSINQVLDQFRKYTPVNAVKNIAYNWTTRERKRSFGPQNAEGTVYIIRSLFDTSPLYIGPRHNLLANYFYVLSHLAYAREQGWAAVVDQLNYPVYNAVCEPVNGTKNPWEYFWAQPDDVSLEEAYKSKNVVLSKQNWYGQWDMGYDVERYTDPEVTAFYHGLSAMVPLNRGTSSYCEKIKADLFQTGEKILGVSVRMGGHSKRAYSAAAGHPRQPDVEEMLPILHEKLTAWGMDRIFLASDSGSAVLAFREAFADRLITMPRCRIAVGRDSMPDRDKEMYLPKNLFRTSLDYLCEMELLAACDGLIGSVSSGLRYAVVRNNGRYRNMDILDYGRFKDDR